MSLKLVINTAVDPFGFSLEKNGICLVSIKQSSNRSFSESLVSQVDQYCRLNNVTLKDINCIGVVNGPGSYTGIRIGVSYAKTLGLSLGCSVIGISSMDALAKQLVCYPNVFGLVLSAKPNYVYFQLFNSVNDVMPISDLLLLTYDDCREMLSSFHSDITIFVSSKKPIFNDFLNSSVTFCDIDIDCSKLFSLLDKKSEEGSIGSYKHVFPNYMSQPKIGA